MSLDKEKATSELVEYARLYVFCKYGPRGWKPLGYHNPAHLRDVYDAALRIGIKTIELNENANVDLDLLVIAAAFHDIEQDLGPGANEEASASVAASKMSIFNFDPPAITMVEAMINSTKVVFEDGIMKQCVIDTPDSCMPMILADADLASLGSKFECFWMRSKGLLFEITKTREPTAEQNRAFLENQIRLLENHKFFTEAAALLFPHQAENLEIIRQVLADLE